VTPSLGPEGLPLVCLEAMSYGMACLFSDLPVHREVACGGSAALLFKLGDAADLREKLQTLVGCEKLRHEYGRLAYSAVQTRHSPEGAARAYREAFSLPASS
jgi:glycosyltransferase involved in cell wall biosynthesis